MTEHVPMIKPVTMEEQSSVNTSDCVYHRIRLEKPLSDSDGKMKWIMNGISANSWFSPCGITDRSDKTSTPYGPVSDEIRACLQERAQSAAAFLGRRHFELDQQALKTDEVLRGRNVYFKSESDITEVKESTKGRFCGKCPSANPKDIRNKLLLQRPQTSYIVRSKVNVDTNFIRPQIESLKIQDRKQPVHSDKKSTCVMCNHDNTNVCNDEDDEDNKEKGDEDVKVKSVEECSGHRKSNKHSFKSARDMKKSFGNRAYSAPPLSRMLKDNQEGALTHRPEGDTTPLYWKTRTIYHRKQLAGTDSEEVDKRVEFLSKGSLLKPLLYQQGTDLKHSAGCPYKCKGCFRACLVSQDYLEGLKQRKIPSGRKSRYVRPKLYHRRIVELALAKSQPIHQMIERRNAWSK